MKKLAMIVVVAISIMVPVLADETDRYATNPPEQRVRFAPLHVYVDSGDESLAAYQFELTVTAGKAKIVGVEGGEARAFEEPPYYDPAALSQGCIIIAAFNTGEDLPQGRMRVATIHLQIIGDVAPEYQVDLSVAASMDGEEVAAEITLEQGDLK